MAIFSVNTTVGYHRDPLQLIYMVGYTCALSIVSVHYMSIDDAYMLIDDITYDRSHITITDM